MQLRGGQIFVLQTPSAENSPVRILTKISAPDSRPAAVGAASSPSLQTPIAAAFALILFFGLGTQPAEACGGAAMRAATHPAMRHPEIQPMAFLLRHLPIVSLQAS
jgi:hypothetical protein